MGRTVCGNAFTALLCVVDLGIDASKPPTGIQIDQAAAWRLRVGDDKARAIADLTSGRRRRVQLYASRVHGNGVVRPS